MRRPICLAACLMISVAAFAHPHIYVDAAVDFLLDQAGVYAVEEEWVLSQAYSAQIAGRFDADKDGTFSGQEQRDLFREAFANLKSCAFFNHFRADGEDYEALEAKDFSAFLRDGRVHYRFTVPLRLAARPGVFALSLYDETNYVTFALRDFQGPEAFLDLELRASVVADPTRYLPTQATDRLWATLAFKPFPGAAPGPSRSLADEIESAETLHRPDPERPAREAEVRDPFLRDPALFNGLSPDNPFLSYN